MTTPRPNSFFSRLVTNTAHHDILTAFCIFAENQIWVVCHLSHLHDEAENIGIVVKHHTLTDIGIELALGIGHDALREVAFHLTEELVVDNHIFWWEFHR
jgi:hypothetical protein